MKTLKSKKTAVPTPAAVTPSAAKAPVTPAPARVAALTTPAANASAGPVTAPRREITTECIASRAYSLWEQQGRPQGHDLELWLQAEKQLKTSQSFAA